MNKKILMIANTYFQLLTSINLKFTDFKYDSVDIIITDNSNKSEKIFSNLKNINLFNNVYYFKTKEIINDTKIKKIKYLVHKDKLFELEKKDYNVLMFFNYDIFTFSIFEMIENVKVIRYEEGFISYLYNIKYDKCFKINKIMDKIFNRKNIENSLEGYYYYHPELIVFDNKTNIYKIKQIDRNNHDFLKIVNRVFDYKDISIPQKYIFFEESFFCDNKDIDDLELILSIADIVGKDNFVVKLHPRNNENRFKKYGISTLENNGIPWEIIQMNNDFSDKVLLTISSGSVLGSRLFFDDNIKTYLLYNCTDKMSDMVTDKYIEYLKKLKKNIGIDSFIIPNRKNEFLNLLRKENEIN